MAETAGLVVGAATIPLAFKGAVDTGLFIGSFFDQDERGCSYVALCYHIEMTRLRLWSDQCKLSDPPNSLLRGKPPDLKKTVIQILGNIEGLKQEANALVDKFNIRTPEVPQANLDDNLRPESPAITTIANISRSTTPNSRFRWVIKGKADFEKIVGKIRHLITNLYQFTLQPSEIHLLATGLIGTVLAPVNREDLLKTLSELDTSDQRSLALLAQAKLLQTKITVDPTGSATIITDKQLRLLSSSSNIGLFQHSDGHRATVRVEWNIVNTGRNTQQYIQRINSLGYVLEQVSEPVLRLPPCLGVVDDVSYEKNHGEKKLGFVFGLPHTNNQKHPYDEDLNRYPPISLSDLMKAKDVNNKQDTTKIPLLGDRFRLAYILSCAFSRFQAAGWLHKGFHTGNILFFQKRGGQGIEVTEPFIAGFQYSRPQGAESLSRSPLEEQTLQHYYHPDAVNGFTKVLDLYSLGVVLCEIGRWKVLEGSKKSNRVEWRRYLLSEVLPDLGWRMGEKYQGAVQTLLDCELPRGSADYEYFSQQFLEKVMKPLSCPL